MSLASILYGSSSLQLGNLLFTAEAAYTLGTGCTLTVTISGSTIGIAIQNPHPGAGRADLVLAIPAGTTEAELMDAITHSPAFLTYATVAQTGGDGTAGVNALAQTQFSAPAGGLLQALLAQLGGIQVTGNFDDRELQATANPVAVLIPFEKKTRRQHPEMDAADIWEAICQLGIALQDNHDLHYQYAVLDRYADGLYRATKIFIHPQLEEIGPIQFVYQDSLKGQAAGQAVNDSNIRTVATFTVAYAQGGMSPAYIAANQVPFKQFQSGLFRQPLTVTGYVLDFDCQFFTLTVNGQTTNALMARTVGEAELVAALQSLSGVGSGNVAVSKQADGTYQIVFGPSVAQPIVFTGTWTGGNSTGDIVAVATDSAPGDLAAVFDSSINVTGLA